MTLLRVAPYGLSVLLVIAGCGGTDPAEARCGIGTAEGSEACDTYDLRGSDCSSFGLANGTLRYHSYCSYDISGCLSSVCGDGVTQAGEECDNTDFDGLTCRSFGFRSGSLSCTTGCTADTSDCVGCGDGVRDPGVEECEGTDLGGVTFVGLGYHAGVLECSSQCELISRTPSGMGSAATISSKCCTRSASP